MPEFLDTLKTFLPHHSRPTTPSDEKPLPHLIDEDELCHCEEDQFCQCDDHGLNSGDQHPSLYRGKSCDSRAASNISIKTRSRDHDVDSCLDNKQERKLHSEQAGNGESFQGGRREPEWKKQMERELRNRESMIRRLEKESKHYRAIAENTLQKMKEQEAYQNELQNLLSMRTRELHSAQVWLGTAESVAGTDVARMVKALNEEILQFAAQIGIFEEERFEAVEAKSERFDGHAIRDLADILGEDTLHYLQTAKGSEDHELAAQCTLQALLLDSCVKIISCWSWKPETDEILKEMYAKLQQKG